MKLNHNVILQAKRVRKARNNLVHNNVKINKSKAASALVFFDTLEKNIYSKEDIGKHFKKDLMINRSSSKIESKLKISKIPALKTSVQASKRIPLSKKRNSMISKVKKSTDRTLKSNDILQIIEYLRKKSTELAQIQKGKNYNQIVRIGNMRCNIVRKIYELRLIQQNFSKIDEDDLLYRLKKMNLLMCIKTHHLNK